MPEKEVGFVEHWFGHIMVAGIKITKGKLKVGDTIHIKGHTSDFTTVVNSMQIDGKEIAEAKKGKDIGIKVAEHARTNDKVYVVTP